MSFGDDTLDPTNGEDRRVELLEKRVKQLEADRDRFLAALEQAAVMCLKMPMVAGIIPKEVKAKLQEIAKRAAS